MPVKKPFVEGLTTVLTKLGVAQNDEVKALLANEELKKIEISEETFNAMGQDLLTVEAAKNHKEVSHHFKGRYNKVLEGAFKKTLKNLGAPEELINEFDELEAETSVKFDTVLKKFKEVVSVEPNDENTKKKIKTLTDTVNDLNVQLGKKDEELATKLLEKETSFDNERVSGTVKMKLAGYTFTDALKLEDAETIIMAKINKLPVVLKRDANAPDGVAIYQKENPELKAMDKSNKPLTLQSLLDEQVSPFVKKNNNGNNGKEGGETEGQETTVTSSGKYGDNAEQLKKDKEKMLASLGKNKA